MMNAVEPGMRVQHEKYGTVTIQSAIVEYEGGFEVEELDSDVFIAGSHREWTEYVCFTDEDGVEMKEDVLQFGDRTNLLEVAETTA